MESRDPVVLAPCTHGARTDPCPKEPTGKGYIYSAGKGGIVTLVAYLGEL